MGILYFFLEFILDSFWNSSWNSFWNSFSNFLEILLRILLDSNLLNDRRQNWSLETWGLRSLTLKNHIFPPFFRDNGITMQISIYQIYCEIFLFLTVLIFIVVEKTTFWARIFGFIGSTMVYVIQPIFYLFGDINFRNRVSNQGIWKAMKKELFENNH